MFKDVDVKVHELDRVKDGRAIQEMLATLTGQRTVPSVWINGRFLGGNDSSQAAFRSGKLMTMLGLHSKL